MTIVPFPDLKNTCGCRAPGWLSLPLAPRAIARSRFCGEEKLPPAVPLQGALAWLANHAGGDHEIAGLCITGPGDPLATVALTLESMTVLRQNYPATPLAISTMGFGLDDHVERLADHGLAQVFLLIDGISVTTIRDQYVWIRPGQKNIPLAKAAELLIEAQEKAMTACGRAGIDFSVISTVYPGINENEVENIASKAGKLGAGSMTLRPGQGFCPVNGSLPPLAVEIMEQLARRAGQHISSVTVEVPKTGGAIIPMAGAGPMVVTPSDTRPNVAVISSNGMDVDLHLGQAINALIYGPREDSLACLLEARDLPEPGSGDNRWLRVAETLHDCFALLAASAGQKPREILGRNGLSVFLIEDNVEGAVDALFGAGNKRKHRLS